LLRGAEFRRSKKTQGNSFFGLAIGFTIVVGAFAGGGISAAHSTRGRHRATDHQRHARRRLVGCAVDYIVSGWRVRWRQACLNKEELVP
jgi:hypothetical protein